MNLSRRTFLKQTAGLLATGTLCGCGSLLEYSDRRHTEPPNVVVILADDMRRDYLGCMGLNPIVQTPNLDSLAKKGTLFNHAFVTTASCTPSRTSILTGQYERKHGVTFGSNSALTENAFARTYPMLLKRQGYYTGYIGKNHTPAGRSEKGFGYKSGHMEEVFDYWYGGHGHLTFYPKNRHAIFKNAEADTQIEILQEGTDNFFEHNPEFANTKTFLRSRPKDKPFCLLINFNVPHGAGTGTMRLKRTDPELYRTAYRDQRDNMPQPKTYIAERDITQPKIPEHVYNGEFIPTYDYVKSPETLHERQVRTCQTVTGIDNLVGNVIGELKKHRLDANTIILFSSDHGLQHGEHGLGGKVLLYEESIRIPLIIYDPRLTESQGRTVDGIALTIDFAPTILDLAGVDVPEQMQGKSLRPLMAGKWVRWRDDFFCENMFMGQNYPRIEAVRSEDYKYIRYYSKDADQHHILSLVSPILGEMPIYEELYDLKNDPLETKNLAENPKYKKVLAKYRLRCDEVLRQAKGDADLPDTYVADFDDPAFKKKVEDIYRKLETKL